MKAILLAAGNSRRFQGNKLLEPFLGRPLYAHTLSLVESLSWEEIILVTQYDEILDACRDRKITLVKNEHPDEGIASSIRLGIKKAGAEADVMFFVCDQPYLKRETIRGMREMFFRHPEGMVCAGTKEQSGNPNIFSRAYYKELIALQGDRGGKRIILAHPEQVRYYPTAEEERKDFDYREDFAAGDSP